jgi:hypothetical protein
MDKATRKLRAQIKADVTPRGQLSPMAPKFVGRKNKPSERLPNSICAHVEGGKKVPIRRKRKDGTHYTLMIQVGGTRCKARAQVKKGSKHLCLAHIGD